MEDKTMRSFRFTKDARANASRICERAIAAMEQASLEEADDILEGLKHELKALRRARGQVETMEARS